MKDREGWANPETAVAALLGASPELRAAEVQERVTPWRGTSWVKRNLS